jgi:glucose/mannose-6-phosphate isomerase
MNLDDLARFRELDTQNMRAHLDSLPSQLEAAFAHGQTLPLPASFKRADRIVIAGMGTSAQAGEMLAALVADTCNVPIIVNRGYDLPAYADGQRTLVIGVSHSGTDEESLAALELADNRGTQIVAITTGGAMAEHMARAGAPAWTYQSDAPARAALGWTFGLLLALINRLGLVRDLSGDVAEAVEVMRGRIPILGIDGPVVKNPAKRLAGQLIGRVPIIHGAGIMVPVARRWKTQLNENAKTVAQWEEMPEMDHNTVQGTEFPPPLMTKVAVIFLSAPQPEGSRLAARLKVTQTIYLQQGLAPDTIKARGSSPLAQMMSNVQFGDYVSYYTAMAYGVDPTPVPCIADLKDKLAAATQRRPSEEE